MISGVLQVADLRLMCIDCTLRAIIIIATHIEKRHYFGFLIECDVVKYT